MLVHDGEVLSCGGEVEAADGRVDGEQGHREGVVDEDLHDLSVLEADQETLALRRTPDHLDVADQRLHDPLSLLVAAKVEALEALLLTEDEVICADDEEVAVDFLVYFLFYSGNALT